MKTNFRHFGFVTIISLSIFCFHFAVISSSQQIHEKVETKDLDPLVESYKSTFHHVAFNNHKVDYIMDGTMYFKKPNLTRSEIKWAKGENIVNVLITFDGRYKWQYYETYKSAVREDTSLQNNDLKQRYGFLPLYTTNDNITYLGKKKFKGKLVRKYVVKPSDRLKKIAPTIDSKREFLIGDKDGIIRAVNFYDDKGNLTFSEEFTVVSTNENFNDELFNFKPKKGVNVQYIPEKKIGSCSLHGMRGMGSSLQGSRVRSRRPVARIDKSENKE